jgi:hypothetical protein
MKTTTKTFFPILILMLIEMLNYAQSQEVQCFMNEDSIIENRGLCEIQSTISLSCANEFYSSSSNNEDYIPNSDDPIKTIRLNINIMQKSDGTDNFQENNQEHMIFLNGIEGYLNYMASGLDEPLSGGPVPSAGYISDSRIRFKVMGIHFWQDDIAWDNNGSSSSLYCFQNYAVDPESSLNIFFYGNYPGQPFAGSGQGLFGECTNAVNLQNLYNTFVENPPGTLTPDGGKPWVTHPLIFHEIGHCLGLRHSWVSNSQFPDKPYETLCDFSDPNTVLNCSNNIMGYSHTKSYLSPQQVGHIHQLIVGGWRGKLVESCNYNPDDNLYHQNGTTVTWNYGKTLGGDLIIKNNSTLIVKCKISMPDNGKVIIEPGSRLIIDGGAFVNNCDDMWLGIDVQGNRALHQTATNQGIVEMKNGAVIEYAKNGIRTIGTDENDIKDWSKTGGIVRIYDGTFRNCRRGIEFLSYANMNPNGTGQEMSNQSFIHNANFVTDEVLPNNVIPYAGLTMFEVRGIRVRNCKFENTRTDIATVPVDERGSGIYSIDANYKVTSGYIISNGNPIAGTGNEFNNLYYGVYTSGGTEWSDVIINDNDFDNCAFGVGITGANYATIGRNNFAIKGGNGTPTLFGQGFGVYTEGAYGFNIEQNTYTSLDPSGFPDQAVHVKQSSDVGTGKVYKNTITNTTYGTQTANNNESLEIDCNNYNKGTKSTIDVHNAIGDLANQGDCSLNGVPAKNLFSGTCDNTSLSQIYNNGNPFIYTYEGTTLDPNCTNLGTNAVPCGLPIANGCPPKLPNNVITPKPVRLSQVKGKIGIVKTDINTLKTNIEEGDSENLITAIGTQNTGNLKIH